MQFLKAAVIGVGKMGRHHARIYSVISGVSLCAVSDADEGTLSASSQICKKYIDYKELLSKEKPDLVSVCVPTNAHAQVTIDCLRAGAHVLVEKPISSTVPEAKKMLLEARRAGKHLMVGHVERFNPAVIELKKIIDSGEIGTPLSVISRRVGIYPPRIKDASVVVDLAVHDIDLMNYFFGALPEKVFCNGGKSILKDRADYAEILLKYRHSTGIVQVNWITPIKVRALVVTGSKGYAEVDYISQELKVYKPSSGLPSEYASFEEFVTAFSKVIERIVKIPREEPLMLELSHFVDSVRTGKTPLVSGEKGLAALRIAKLAERQIA
ncbi:MAG: Gfo/Idh/MocA family oxidoreductase [archaeon]